MTMQNAGVQVGRTVTPRKILLDTDFHAIIDGILDSAAYDGGQASGYESYIRGGWILGFNSTTKRWTLCKQSTTSTTGSVTSAVVANSYPFKVGDVITIGGDTDITLTGVNYSTHTLTWSGSKTIASGEAVIAQDGSQIARGILLNDEIELYDYEKRTLVNKPIKILARGSVFNSSLLGDVSAIFTQGNTNSMLYHRIIRDSEYT